ncbi:MAG: amino acid ABC transporter substrate-binding protein [Curvibacter sp.]|nr:amino acid ABC transporter substrate-binding protein [Curvibacter sp.]
MKHRAMLWDKAFVIIALLAAGVVHAQQSVIERVKAGGKLVIAHRESSVPFSYIDPDTKRPMGYAVDICLKLADALGRKIGVKAVPVEFLMVTPANRINMIAQGKADLECGSTTNNAERREKVAFTVPHFITGARMAVKADSTIERLEDLRGKKLASTKATTPLKAAQQVNTDRLLGISIIEAPDHAKALDMVDKGEAQAFLMDDVLLFGLIAIRPDSASFKVVGKFVTTEPLAIMLNKRDLDFKVLVDDEMRRLILSREIYPIYDKWFMRPIPLKNTALKMPMSYLLKEFWKYPSDRVPF